MLLNRLTLADVAATHPPGKHLHDGGGLYLVVGPSGARSWTFRYRVGSGHRKIGLGSVEAVTLKQARDKAAALRGEIASGKMPAGPRSVLTAPEIIAKAQAKAEGSTFLEVAEDYIATQAPKWKNPKSAAQWRASLAAYAFDVIGDLRPADITRHHVVECLKGIWFTKSETASRVRGRIEAVLHSVLPDDAINPAGLKLVSKSLPGMRQSRAVAHHKALPFEDVPRFMVKLSAHPALAARALEFTILTAARTSEVLGARWSEIDIDSDVWVVPADRMKGQRGRAREHRVPLTPQAWKVLAAAQAFRVEGEDFIFPGEREKRPLSNMAMLTVLRRMKVDVTTHGFRSSFRDWAAETTSHPSEVVEMALAHVVGNKVEAAYRRGDLFEKRRQLMADWSKFCMSSGAKAEPLTRDAETVRRVRVASRAVAERKARLAKIEADKLADAGPVKRGRGRPRKMPVDPLGTTPNPHKVLGQNNDLDGDLCSGRGEQIREEHK